MRARGLVFAMEEENVEVVEPTEEVPAEVEQNVGEAEEQAGDIEEFAGSVDEATDDADTMEAVGDKLQETVDEGGEGASPEAVEIAEIAVESLCRRLGVKTKGRVLPAMESFQSPTTRVAATRIAIEKIGETVRRVWEAIKAAFTTVVTKIKEFFAKLFDANASLEKAAKQVKETLKDLPNEPKLTGEQQASFLNSGKLINVLKSFPLSKSKPTKYIFQVIHGKYVDGDLICEYLGVHKNYTKQINDAMTTYLSLFKAADGIVGQALKGEPGKEMDLDISPLKEELFKFVKTATNNQVEIKTEGDDQDATSKVGPFVGGNYLVTRVKMDGILPKINMSFEHDQDNVPVEKVELFTKDDMTKIVDAVLTLTSETAIYKQMMSRFEESNKAGLKMIDSIFKFLETSAKAASDNGESNIGKTLSELRTASSAMINTSVRMMSGLPSLNVRAGKAALHAVTLSFPAYK